MRDRKERLDVRTVCAIDEEGVCSIFSNVSQSEAREERMDLFFGILAIVAVNLALYYFCFRHLSYFKDRGIPYQKGYPFVGSLGPLILLKKSLPELVAQYYEKFSNAKYFGVFDFLVPTIVIRDPELISSVTVKNFDNFVDHRPFPSAKKDILLKFNLFQLPGDEWRDVRKIVSPSFTSSKMKMMFTLIQDCAVNFVNFVESKSQDPSGWSVEAKGILVRYTCDAVASSAFGFQVDSMKHPKNDFYVIIRERLAFDGILSLKIFLIRSMPWLVKLLQIKMFDEKTTNFFLNIIRDSVKLRKETNFYRPDLIQLMLESKEKVDLSIEEMTSQAFTFFFAGSESVASLLCFFVYQMAINPEAQAKLREEIDEAMGKAEEKGRPSYDCIMHLKYLDAAMNEVLRLYPLTSFVDRVCVKSFELPPATPNGKSITLTPGTNLWIPSYALHRDPKYFPEPEKFRPERFIGATIDPSIYLPFGAGPRICVGNRYALMLAKVLLFHLFAKCEVEPCEKTAIPLVLSPKAFIMTAKNGFWVKIRTRNSTTANNVAKDRS